MRLMKYSLRSLMIVVTLSCVMLGSRIEYLRQQAVFHERNARRCALEIDEKIAGGPFRQPLLLIHQWQAHEELARDYRLAICRPWRVVTKPLPPKSEDEMMRRMRDD